MSSLPDNRENPRVPKWAEKFFLWYCSPEVEEEIGGDLYERFLVHVNNYGLKKARRLYVLNVIKFISWHTLKRQKPTRNYSPFMMYSNYFKVAIRNLSKNFSYSIINIVGLSIGLTCFILIYFYVNQQLSFDKYHTKHERIYRIPMTWMFGETIYPSPDGCTAVGPLVASELAGIESYVRFGYKRATIVKNKDHLFEETGFAHADSTLFQIFDFPLLQGNPDKALTKPRSLVISEEMALKYFGSDWRSINLIGKGLDINNGTEYQITGVMANIPINSHIQFDFVGSFSSLPEANKDPNWDSSGYPTYVLFNKKQDIKITKNDLQLGLKRKYGDDFPAELDIESLDTIYLKSSYGNNLGSSGDIKYIFMFSTIAILILLIACINYMNLITARSVDRAREVGLRKVLGAERSQLIRQFMAETLIVTFTSIIIALGLGQLTIPLFKNISGINFDIRFLLEPINILLVVGLGMVVSFTAGIYPALVLTRFAPIKVLKGSFNTSSSGNILRKSLIIFQFSISIFLIVGTLVINNQLNYVQNKKLGYDKENVLRIPLDEDTQKKLTVLKDNFNNINGVLGSTVVHDPISNITFGTTINIVGKNEEKDRQLLNANKVDENFAKLFNLDFIAGSNFHTLSNEDKGYYIILNESASSFFNWSEEEALGNKMQIWGSDTATIIGVVKDFHYTSMRKKIEPLVLFTDNSTFFYDEILVRIDNQNIRQTISSLESRWDELVTHRPFDYQFMDESYNQLYKSESNLANLFILFASLAIFIASMGLFGLSSFMAQQKSKEIGIRKVLGASIANILSMLTKDFTRLVLISAVIAIPAAWYFMDQWLASFAYKISIGVEVVIISFLIALLIALTTVSYQSLKAALANPTNTIRNNE